MLLVIQTATIAAVAIAFAKFTAVIVPWFSASAWIWKLGTFGPWQLWFGALGPYNVGLNRQNLLAILSIVFLTWVNTQGLRFGKIVQNVFTVTKALSLAALVILGFLVFHFRRPRRQLHPLLAQCRVFPRCIRIRRTTPPG